MLVTTGTEAYRREDGIAVVPELSWAKLALIRGSISARRVLSILPQES